MREFHDVPIVDIEERGDPERRVGSAQQPAIEQQVLNLAVLVRRREQGQPGVQIGIDRDAVPDRVRVPVDQAPVVNKEDLGLAGRGWLITLSRQGVPQGLRHR